jgi:hypothetical protein
MMSSLQDRPWRDHCTGKANYTIKIDVICRSGISVVKMYWVPHLKPILRQLHGTESLREVEKRFTGRL